jgi:UDP-N-acetylglucosamine 2-epimerase (non-hydrolysing)
MLIDLIAGARPNFIKISPIIRAIKNKQESNPDLKYRLIHTGQHYDKIMSDSFFEQLDIPDPDINFGAGGGTQGEQTSKIILAYEKLLLKKSSDICIVVGDVTSTMACAITAQKMHIPVAHVEAGIRSGDWKMPEEINRLVTDAITNYFFTTTVLANQNLINNGVNKDRIYFVGNTMIDTLLYYQNKLIKPVIWKKLNLASKKYIVLTLHRPSNVDKEEKLKQIIYELMINSRNLPIIFPVHPRTAKVLNSLGVSHENLHIISPLSYLEFNFLVKHSKAVVTDSGGITEEATVMNIPCMTLRDNTERQETIEIGTNELLGTNPKAIKPAMDKLFYGKWKQGNIPKLWDGKTGDRIIKHLMDIHPIIKKDK